jgi:small neutral amino acid transporter SnatA (MarC family)
MKQIETTHLFLENTVTSDEEFENKNLLSIISSAIFMISGPLFVYFGFYLVTSPFTVKWGALSIAVGLFVLLFGFSIWQDRQIQVQWHMMKKENEEMKGMLREILGKTK